MKPLLSQFDKMNSHQKFSKEFIVKGQLGEGGFSKVFEAESRIDRQTYAVKQIVLRNRHRDYEEQVERILREVRTLARTDHPHVLRYFNSWIELVYSQKNKSDMHKKSKAIQEAPENEFVLVFEGGGGGWEEEPQNRKSLDSQSEGPEKPFNYLYNKNKKKKSYDQQDSFQIHPKLMDGPDNKNSVDSKEEKKSFGLVFDHVPEELLEQKKKRKNRSTEQDMIQKNSFQNPFSQENTL